MPDGCIGLSLPKKETQLTLAFVSQRRSALTGKGQGSGLSGMQSSKPAILGMSLSRFAARAKQAGESAVAANLQAGIPVTGLTNGRLQTITPDDYRAVNLMAKARNVETA